MSNLNIVVLIGYTIYECRILIIKFFIMIKALVKMCYYHNNILSIFSKNNENLVCFYTFLSGNIK